MRIRSLLASLLLTSSLNPAQAQGTGFLATGTPIQAAGPVNPCAGATAGDGCAGAPAPLTAQWRQPNAFQSGDFFNTISGSPTNYMATNCGSSGAANCRPSFLVGGVGYAIGNYTSVASLLDPATNPIPGCLFYAAGASGGSGTGGNIYRCAGGAPVDPSNVFAGVAQHLNLGPVGGHGCTALSIGSPTSGASALLIDDIYWFNDTGLCSVGVSLAVALSVPGAWPGGVTFTSTYMDGNSDVFDDNFGGCSAPTQCNPSQAFAIDFNHAQNIKYVVTRNFANRTINGPVGTSAAYNMQYSWVESWDKRPQNGHSEWYNGATGPVGVRNITIDHDVILGNRFTTQFGPSPTFAANNYPTPVDVSVFTNNTQINAWVGGGTKTATVWGCYGSTLTSATPATSPTCSGAGQNFYATQITGAIGQGQAIPFNNGSACGGTNFNFWLYKPISIPSGAVGAWQIDTQTGVGVGPGNCTAAPASAEAANIAVWSTHGPTPLGSSTFGGNYLDVSSQPGSPPVIWVINGLGPSTITRGAISGTNLLASASQTLTTGELIYAADVPGCSTSVLSCLTVSTGGTAANFTLSGSANVGPENFDGFFSEVSFTGTTNGTTTLTTSTAVTLTAGDLVYAPTVPGCSAAPTSCPKIQTTDGSPTTTHALAATASSVGPISMSTIRLDKVFNGTINNATVGAIASGTTLLPSTSFATLEFITASSGTLPTGCSTNIISCPSIVTGGQGTSFTLSHSGGTITTTSLLQHQQPSWCTTPTVFAPDNIDMSAILSDAYLDQWSDTSLTNSVGCI
jgi:hypothetical protein